MSDLRRRYPTPTAASTVPIQTQAVIELLREYDQGRRWAFDQLIGHHVEPSPLRDELIRLLILDCAEGQVRRIVDYEPMLRPFGSRPTLRAEVQRLVDRGLALQAPPAPGQRGDIIRASQFLVDWYGEQEAEIVIFLKRGLAHLTGKNKPLGQ